MNWCLLLSVSIQRTVFHSLYLSPYIFHIQNSITSLTQRWGLGTTCKQPIKTVMAFGLPVIPLLFEQARRSPD